MEPTSRRGRSAPVETRVQQVDGGAGVDVFEVVFQKGEHQWRFRYVGGDESAMIEAVRDIMRRDVTGGGGLDWVDVSLIAHEIRSGAIIEVVRKKEGIL